MALLKAPRAAFAESEVQNGGGGGNGDAASKLRGYQSSLEAFNATIKEVAASNESAADKSRAVVQALLDYANAADSVAAAVEQIPGLTSLISADDAAFVSGELAQIAADAVRSVSTGYARIEADRQQAVAELEAARRDAMAAGIEDTGWYFEKLDEIERDYAAKRRELDDGSEVPFPYDMQALSEEMQASIDDLEFEVAGEELRQVMRANGVWKPVFLSLLPAAGLGGLVGALLLLNTSERLFYSLVPWLLLLGSGLLWAQPSLRRWIGQRLQRQGCGRPRGCSSRPRQVQQQGRGGRGSCVGCCACRC
jgi:hypothetical protein